MASKSEFFIAIYTNAVKDYCDREFFKNLQELSGDSHISIIDNTFGEEKRYMQKLVTLCLPNFKDFEVKHLEVQPEPKRTQFLRNVAESVELLRKEFLASECKYFLIIESDVIPPKDTLRRFKKDIGFLDDLSDTYVKPWGILGAVYYRGFHDMNHNKLLKTHHALSGCTVYKRELLEKYPFRFMPENLDAFPDAVICHDSGNEYAIYNDHSIKCHHLAAKSGARASRPL